MKRCGRCKEHKNLDCFRVDRKRKQPVSYCAECEKQRGIDWYQKNKEKTYQAKLNSVQRNKAFMFEYKNNTCCVECGENRWKRLVFHHTNPDEKEYSISKMVYEGYSIAKIEDEIDKCVIMCYNCHMELHTEDFVPLV